MVDNIIKRLADRLRISITKILFKSEMDERVNVAEIGYSVVDKNPVKFINPNTGKADHRFPIYKKSSESIDMLAEPLLEDLMYINKIVTEIYITDLLGIKSEAKEQGIIFENNKCMQLLESIRKPNVVQPPKEQDVPASKMKIQDVATVEIEPPSQTAENIFPIDPKNKAN